MTQSDNGADPVPGRVTRVLQGFFLVQLVAMLAFVAGGALLIATFAHNNSTQCTGFFASGAGCDRHSYALPVGLLVGGFATFAVSTFVTAQYAIRHVGAPLLGALRAKRRILERQASAQVPGSPTG